MEKAKEVEHSLTKKFRKTIYKRLINAVDKYKLIEENDKIAVCISGGKDSILLAKCLQVLKKHWLLNFELEFICMDPGYSKQNRKQIEDNCKMLDIDVKFFDTNIFEIVSDIEKSPCYLCARMRRGHLYNYAKSLGCNKIALGHHFDDAVETVLLSMFYGAEFKTMMPKLKSSNFENMQLIRPLFLVRERDIIHFRNYHNLSFLQCACKLTEKTADGSMESKRSEIKQLLANLKKINEAVDINIFKSISKVNLDTVLGYVENGQSKTFLDDY